MPLQTLAPDQRAVVQLILQRERSYAQIAELLSISEDAVRARAHAGLAALAPDVELPADKLAQISDFLLGQQNGKPRQATRRLLRSSNGAREWAETVRAQLEDVDGAPLPELPAKAGAKAAAQEAAPAATEAPVPDGRPRSARPPTSPHRTRRACPARGRSGTSRARARAPVRAGRRARVTRAPSARAPRRGSAARC